LHLHKQDTQRVFEPVLCGFVGVVRHFRAVPLPDLPGNGALEGIGAETLLAGHKASQATRELKCGRTHPGGICQFGDVTPITECLQGQMLAGAR
jgi:hypothetical protein